MEIIAQFKVFIMAGRFISILFVLLINFHFFVSEYNEYVEDLPSLIAAFSSNTTKTDNILRSTLKIRQLPIMCLSIIAIKNLVIMRLMQIIHLFGLITLFSL